MLSDELSSIKSASDELALLKLGCDELSLSNEVMKLAEAPAKDSCE
jgi:hypothetical protein